MVNTCFHVQIESMVTVDVGLIIHLPISLIAGLHDCQEPRLQYLSGPHCANHYHSFLPTSSSPPWEQPLAEGHPWASLNDRDRDYFLVHDYLPVHEKLPV